MTSNRPGRARRLAVAGTLGLAAVTGAACGGGTDASPPTPRATDTSSMEPASTHVHYADDVLDVGGIRLRQFPGYQESQLFKPPRWGTVAELVIEAKDDRNANPVVAAAVFQQTPRFTTNPMAPMDIAEKNLGIHDAPVTAEGAIKRVSYECWYRVKHGPIDAQGTRSAAGTIVAVGSGTPDLGLFIDGSDQDRVRRLTLEIAEALCAGR